MVSITQPGGGYGPAFEREVARVHKDVEEGWISKARARDTYGVAFDDAGNVDATVTNTLRGV
jgi:N-methylhydantoinase B